MLLPRHLPMLLLPMAAMLGCQGPTVNLATTEPIKVDISMRLDVYQHGGTAAKPTATPSADPETARTNRMAEIQKMKNARVVGEGRAGLLVIKNEPAGDYGDYVRRTVAAENADRREVMKKEAEKAQKPLPEIQSREAALWRQRSFRGEWIEAPGDAESEWRWVQKDS